MTDYFTLDNDDATRYPESTQNENEFRTMIDAEVVDADESLDDAPGLDAPEPIRLIDEPMEDDTDEVDDNPVAALADTFPVQVEPLATGESAFNEEEARRRTEELKVKLLHALEAQYDLIQAAQTAFEGHIWVALGYPQGMKGWEAYCKDHFTSDQIRVTGQARTDLILGFDPSKISNNAIAALLGVSHTTVDRAIAKAGREKARKVVGADGKVRSTDTLTSEETAELAWRLKQEGKTQNEIAQELGKSQSTISTAISREHNRLMSEGLKAVAKPESDEFVHADDDEIIDTSDQLGEEFDQDVITTMTRDIANLAEAIDEVINDLESDEWKPGSLVVSTIMEKSNRRLMHFYDAFCKLLRLHYIQSDDLYDGDDNKYDMFLEMIVFIRKTIESIENDREDEAGEFDFSKFED